jgi:hypothetical protein
MRETNDRVSKPEKNSQQDAAESDSEATSKETLSDIEESEANVSSLSPHDPGPSPDGTFDEGGEIKDDAGPM